MNEPLWPTIATPTLASATDAELLDECRKRGLIETAAEVVLPDALDAFDEFWSRYPRKVGKKAARRAWDRLDHDSRLAAIDAIDAHTQVWWKEGRSSATIPHASTWLNGERWEDEIGYVPPRPEQARVESRSTTALRNVIERKAGR